MAGVERVEEVESVSLPSPAIAPSLSVSAIVSRNLRLLRLVRGWSQRELAERILPPIARSYISKLELGRIASPQLEQLVRLAAALGVPLAALLESDELAMWTMAAARRMREVEREALVAWCRGRAEVPSKKDPKIPA